jgi:hypothetical protein
MPPPETGAGAEEDDKDDDDKDDKEDGVGREEGVVYGWL